MSLHHYFLKDQVLALEAENIFPLLLSSEDFKHARAQRLHAGEHISIIDACGHYYECAVEEFSNQLLLVRIAKKLKIQSNNFSVSLAFANLKSDKNEQVIKACTELGIEKFFIFNSSRSVSLIREGKVTKKLARYASIAKSSAMQSGSNFIPKIELCVNLSLLCKKLGSFDKILLFWEEAKLQNTLNYHLNKNDTGKFLLIIGPEGGFSPADILEISRAYPCTKELSLGPKILRAETACIVASAIAMSCLQN